MNRTLGFDGGLTCALECADLDRSIAWCQEHLGFELIYRVDDLGWCELRSPVERVNVGYSQVEAPEVRGGATLTFGVTDLDRARGHLEERGVRFDGDNVVHPGMVKLATFYDPDGNKMMLYQDLSGQEE
jgi:catechol 2,3-dioxygenase-like lactoylglutathione lyase family enzyme